MKTFFTPMVTLTVVLALAACGRPEASSVEDAQADASATMDATSIHKIQPLNVSTSCMGSGARTVRDHRGGQTTTYQQYFLQMKGCSAPESSLVIQMLGGQQWVGGLSYVTIKKNGLCLTNIAANTTVGTDLGESRWEPCIAQQSSAPDHYRQQWLLVFNTHNAMRIESHAVERMGFQNPIVQCLDRQDPTRVSRVACTLNNWQIIRAN